MLVACFASLTPLVAFAAHARLALVHTIAKQTTITIAINNLQESYKRVHIHTILLPARLVVASPVVLLPFFPFLVHEIVQYPRVLCAVFSVSLLLSF
eukprot:m.63030 g.63030  ORF g.63030 m.63030 type:complete len:97 (-) comp11427_c0_seq1:1080-1370(-)